MHLPQRSLVLKTAAVFIAAVCLFLCLSGECPRKKVSDGAPPLGKTSGSSFSSPIASTTQTLPQEQSEGSDLAKFTFATLWGREKDPALAAFSEWAIRFTNA